MKILTSSQIRKVDSLTIEKEPIASIDLMERAAFACYRKICEQFGKHRNVIVFAGPGNNGGDGLALARMLASSGSRVRVVLLSQPSGMSADTLQNYHRLLNHKEIDITHFGASAPLPGIHADDLVIDALFGTGLSRPLDGPAATLVQLINQSDATILSIDIPSGLSPDHNPDISRDGIVHADFTYTFQVPKRSFFYAENESYLGLWTVLDIGLLQEALNDQPCNMFLTEESEISQMLKHRRKFAHKGHFGHALLIAGSYGKIGAAVLASRACLRAGTGLLTTQVPLCGYEILQSSVPEAMTIADPDYPAVSFLPELEGYQAIGIGPGIGKGDKTALLLKQLLTTTSVPLVLDADALNLLAQHPEWIKSLPPNSVLTPHPGEFDRLTGPSASGSERHQKQIEFSEKYNVIVILKGAYTSISSPNGKCWFNPTGNPGMATGGSGDVLTGIVLSLLAQKYAPLDAGRLAVFLHGLAGDLACEAMGEEALLASDIINYLGSAFQKIKKHA